MRCRNLELMSPGEARECFCAFVHHLLQRHQEAFWNTQSEQDLEIPLIRLASEALSAACRLVSTPQYLAILQHIIGSSAGSQAAKLQVSVCCGVSHGADCMLDEDGYILQPGLSILPALLPMAHVIRTAWCVCAICAKSARYA